ncbi:TRAP transporter permease [Salinisphaera aquimarina]|uniref:TRAP transporter permease n=1 Tax=Salinisphaera aquimarina TaxID=2094031 RepID=A0ABV7EMM3_9GAMM
MGFRVLVLISAFALAAFHIGTGFLGVYQSFTQRNAHLLLITVVLAMTTLDQSQGSRVRRGITLAATVALAAAVVYNLYFSDYFANRMAYVTPLSTLSIAMAIVGLIGLFIVAIRSLGGIFGLIIAVFMAYAAFGHLLPGLLGHRYFGVSWTLDHIWYTKEGVFGIPLGVSATYIYLFVLFGAVLDRCGGGKFLIDLAMALTGRMRGGPAKASVVGSAAMGTISGSAVANVVTTGAVTIPLMKRNGYRADFAAGVEAAASSGGQLMPPVMGATAFVIAEFVGRPYAEVAVSAIIPALLMYLGIFCTVHFEALRTGIAAGTYKTSASQTMRDGGLFLLPLVVIAYSVFAYSPMRAGLNGIACVLGIALVYASMHGNLRRLPGWLTEGVLQAARAIGPVAIACAAAGIIVGILSLTGLGITINGAILDIAGHSLLGALLLTMISSLILGMGLPTVAAYLVQAGVTIPALVALGVAPIAAHLFAFYFAILGNVTPPVAVAAYAAAAVADSNPGRTGWTAFSICIPAFIVPYMFVLDPVLLMDGKPLQIVLSVTTAAAGVASLSAAIIGYLTVSLGWLPRVILALGALLLINPGWWSDASGLALIGSVLACTWQRHPIAHRSGDDI